jgi:hypothetical protein
MDGEPVPLPETWETCSEGEFCLSCRRSRAAEAALDRAPAVARPEDQAKVRRSGLVEFEVRRTPALPDRAIAKACRTTTATVAAARRNLGMDTGPVRGPN